MRIIWSFLVLAPIFLLIASGLKAQEGSIDCNNRFLTLVNPVRGRDKWSDKTISPLINQYSLVKEVGFAATWLLQYDALIDPEIASTTKGFDPNQEIGLFLEVSPDLAKDARVIYPGFSAWASPKAVFLSGYRESERRKLLNTLFGQFKDTFGYYPKSIGAWWIDSYSLNYLSQKYGVNSAMIVADQKTTDNYGVWGQWWGIPYYPSKANVLTPASSKESQMDLVVIQWAQRDLSKAYGEGPAYSNYSLQANDYISLGKNTDYFNGLIKNYLDCGNEIGQVTVGLETGIEGASYLTEYENQLIALSKIQDLMFVTMSDFAQSYMNYYSQNPEEVSLSDGDSEWLLTPQKRMNQKLGDEIFYNPQISFSDYFVADTSNFLDRRLESNPRSPGGRYFPYYLLVWGALSILFILKKKVLNSILATLFLGAGFGLLLRSTEQFGWVVYFGPVLQNLALTQTLIVLVVFAGFYFFRPRLLALILPLTFGLDVLLVRLRYTEISSSRYFGLAWDALRFVGLKFQEPFRIAFVNQDFPNEVASSLLKLNFDKVWENPYMSLFIYPAIHLAVGLVIYKLIKKSSFKTKLIILSFLALLFALHLSWVLAYDPRVTTYAL